MQSTPQTTTTNNYDQKAFNTNEKPKDVRRNNIMAAKTLADVIRTSLGPRGMVSELN